MRPNFKVAETEKNVFEQCNKVLRPTAPPATTTISQLPTGFHKCSESFQSL